MGEILDTLAQEFALSSAADLTRLVTRLLTAVLLGGAIGYNREHLGKAAGLRTHVVVALGSAVFVLAGEGAGMASADLSRIVQGLVTGIGFLGGGTILKLTDRQQVKGLTTAATIWLTCGVGICVGFGRYALATLAVGAALAILNLVRYFEPQIEPPDQKKS